MFENREDRRKARKREERSQDLGAISNGFREMLLPGKSARGEPRALN